MIAGIYGIIALTPQFFLEKKNGIDFPPAITHSEYYYGFHGVAFAWQVVFLIMARDPIRYRAIMLPAVLEKASFGIATLILFLQHRLNPLMFAAGVIDLILGLLFIIAYIKTDKQQGS